MQNLWTLKALPEKDIVNSLKESLGVSELVATLLAQRGIETYKQAKKFFRPKLSSNTSNHNNQVPNPIFVVISFPPPNIKAKLSMAAVALK